MNNNDDKKTEETNLKSKGELVWDLFLTGGWSSFNKEWRNSKSTLRTTMMFLFPVLGTVILMLLGILAANILN